MVDHLASQGSLTYDRENHPVVTNLPGTVPFAFVTDESTRTLYLTAGQLATCWITAVGDYLYVSNAGSATVSICRADADGSLQPIGTAATDPGTVDSAASRDGRYLYVQTGGQGILDAFAIERDGTLTPIRSVTVPNVVGGEGIAAS